MKRGVMKFTACCLALGMTVSGSGSVAFAKGNVLAGFGASVGREAAAEPEVQSVAGQVVAPETDAPEANTEAPEVNTEAQVSDTEAAEVNTEAQVSDTEAAEVNTEAQVSDTEAPAAQAETSAQEEEMAEPEAAETEAVPETEPTLDTSMSGELAFAQCEEYINVRSGASADSEVVGKVYNNGSVTILGQLGDWYQVQSGNATGYVKAEFFAIGEAAQNIADEVAYNVATVYPEALMVRSEPSEDSEPIGTVYSTDELEVVQYEGDWMKVALGNDVYGYVNAYYVGYDTYYATAETLDEEQARLDQEWLDHLAAVEAEEERRNQEWLDYLAQQEAEQAAAEQAYLAQIAAESQGTSEQYSQASSDAQAAADAEYQEYLDAQAAADAATQQADEQQVIDTAAAAEQAYQEFLNAQAAADQAAVDQAYQEQLAAEQAAAAEQVPEVSYDEPTYEEPAAEAPTYEEPAYEEPAVEAPSSSYGSQIVNFATQFVGNPYVWGGTSLTNGADCSGFTQSVFANFGISIPRTAAAQSGSGTPVDLGSIQAGDLLFYSGGSGIGHVTMYMGNGQVVHASNSNTGIIISDVGYRTPVSARRYW